MFGCGVQVSGQADARDLVCAAAGLRRFGTGSGPSVQSGRLPGLRLVLVPVLRVAVGNRVRARRMARAWARASANTSGAEWSGQGNKAQGRVGVVGLELGVGRVLDARLRPGPRVKSFK